MGVARLPRSVTGLYQDFVMLQRQLQSNRIAALSRFIISHLTADMIGSCFSPVHVQMVLSVLQVTALCLHERGYRHGGWGSHRMLDGFIILGSLTKQKICHNNCYATNNTCLTKIV